MQRRERLPSQLPWLLPAPLAKRQQ